jgi:hypothetical protein
MPNVAAIRIVVTFLCFALWNTFVEVSGAAAPVSPSPPQPAVTNVLASPFARVVLIGASASAGFTASEPLGGPNTAQYRLNRYIDAAIKAPHEPVGNLASTFFFLQPETEGKRQVELALDKRPTLVLGADFLFWFCYGEGPTDRDRLRRFETGLKLCEAFHCPLVLGDIPDASSALHRMLSPDEIPAASAISAANRRLKEWATARSNISILPLSNFMATVVANRALAVHGRALERGKTAILLQEDMLHPSPPGCAVLALLLLDAFRPNSSSLMTSQIRWDPKEVFRLAYPSAQPARGSPTEVPH